MLISRILNSVGLGLNIFGIILLFIFGFPQPTHEEGTRLLLEDATPLANGQTAAQHDATVRSKKSEYVFLSRLALFSIVAGFLFQLWAVWR